MTIHTLIFVSLMLALQVALLVVTVMLREKKTSLVYDTFTRIIDKQAAIIHAQTEAISKLLDEGEVPESETDLELFSSSN